MIEILEIPVITLVSDSNNENDFENLIKGHVDRNYDGFRHIEKNINPNKSVYFYFLENAVEKDEFQVWDRIIPKSAFCMVLFDWEHPDFDRIVTAYRNRYQTPLTFVTFSAPPDAKRITSQILKEGEIRVIFVEKNSDEGIESILTQGIHFSYPHFVD